MRASKTGIAGSMSAIGMLRQLRRFPHAVVVLGNFRFADGLPGVTRSVDVLVHQVQLDQVSVTLQGHTDQLTSSSNLGLAKQLLKRVLDGAL